MQKMNEQKWLDRAILREIFSWLPPHDLIVHVPRVCKHFARACGDDLFPFCDDGVEFNHGSLKVSLSMHDVVVERNGRVIAWLKEFDRPVFVSFFAQGFMVFSRSLCVVYRCSGDHVGLCDSFQMPPSWRLVSHRVEVETDGPFGIVFRVLCVFDDHCLGMVSFRTGLLPEVQSCVTRVSKCVRLSSSLLPSGWFRAAIPCSPRHVPCMRSPQLVKHPSAPCVVVWDSRCRFVSVCRPLHRPVFWSLPEPPLSCSHHWVVVTRHWAFLVDLSVPPRGYRLPSWCKDTCMIANCPLPCILIRSTKDTLFIGRIDLELLIPIEHASSSFSGQLHAFYMQPGYLVVRSESASCCVSNFTHLDDESPLASTPMASRTFIVNREMRAESHLVCAVSFEPIVGRGRRTIVFYCDKGKLRWRILLASFVVGISVVTRGNIPFLLLHDGHSVTRFIFPSQLTSLSSSTDDGGVLTDRLSLLEAAARRLAASLNALASAADGDSMEQSEGEEPLEKIWCPVTDIDNVVAISDEMYAVMSKSNWTMVRWNEKQSTIVTDFDNDVCKVDDYLASVSENMLNWTVVGSSTVKSSTSLTCFSILKKHLLKKN